MITKPERPINIKDLVIEEPKAKKEDEIDSLLMEEWPRTVALINQTLRRGIDYQLMKSAMYAVMLKPEFRKDILLRGHHVDIFKKDLEDIRVRPQYSLVLEEFRTLFPDYADMYLVSREQHMRIASVFIDELKKPQIHSDTLEPLAAYKRMYPDAMRRFNFDEDEIWNKVKPIDPPGKVNAALKILFPERFEKETHMTENALKAEMARINDLKGQSGNEVYFLPFCYYYKVLAAQSLEFTNGGMKMIMPEQISETTTPALPEARRY